MDEDLELTVDGKVYRSLDELPAELRDKLAPHVEKARAAAAAAAASAGGTSGARPKIRINLTHKTTTMKLGGSLKVGGGSAPAPDAAGQPGGGPMLGASSGGAWRQWLFWLVLFAGAVLLFQRLKGR